MVNLEESKTYNPEQRFEMIKADIQSCLNEGYDIKDLKPEDAADLNGFAWGIMQMETAFHNLDCFIGDSIHDKLEQETAESIYDDVYRFMIASGTDLVYSIMDGYEDE